jgi:hypothetical protein
MRRVVSDNVERQGPVSRIGISGGSLHSQSSSEEEVPTPPPKDAKFATQPSSPVATSSFSPSAVSRNRLSKFNFDLHLTTNLFPIPYVTATEVQDPHTP